MLIPTLPPTFLLITLLTTTTTTLAHPHLHKQQPRDTRDLNAGTCCDAKLLVAKSSNPCTGLPSPTGQPTSPPSAPLNLVQAAVSVPAGGNLVSNTTAPAKDLKTCCESCWGAKGCVGFDYFNFQEFPFRMDIDPPLCKLYFGAAGKDACEARGKLGVKYIETPPGEFSWAGVGGCGDRSGS